MYARLYGELLPIPADRVLLMADGMRLKLGARTFEFIDAPGHARHHHCPIDLDHRDVYAGDNFGICYREFDTAAGPFMLPTTTPVHFEPDVLHRTIDRLLSYRPRRIVQTHFGPVTDLERLARDLHADLDALVAMGQRHRPRPIARNASGTTCSSTSTRGSMRTAMQAALRAAMNSSTRT